MGRNAHGFAGLREQENPRYVVDLIRSLVSVKLETQKLIAELAAFEVIDELPKAPSSRD